MFRGREDGDAGAQDGGLQSAPKRAPDSSNVRLHASVSIRAARQANLARTPARVPPASPDGPVIALSLPDDALARVWRRTAREIPPHGTRVVLRARVDAIST
jgi:hypothetical protein